MGRRIASVPGFSYSPGLKRQTRVWNEAKLDAFLRAPDTFAPGTTMKLHGLDESSRNKVIKQLMKKSN